MRWLVQILPERITLLFTTLIYFTYNDRSRSIMLIELLILIRDFFDFFFFTNMTRSYRHTTWKIDSHTLVIFKYEMLLEKIDIQAIMIFPSHFYNIGYRHKMLWIIILYDCFDSKLIDTTKKNTCRYLWLMS